MTKRFMVLPLVLAALLGTPFPAKAAEPSCTDFNGLSYDVFIVFFDSDSAAITPEASRILENVAMVYRPLPHCRLVVAAHADRVGSEAYNLALSERRAHAVVTHLRGLGVLAPALIEPFGESRQLVETDDEVAERQNRRAEINIAPRDR